MLPAPAPAPRQNDPPGTMEPTVELEQLGTMMKGADHPWLAVLMVAAIAFVVVMAVQQVVRYGLVRWILLEGTLPRALLERTHRPMSLAVPSLALVIVWAISPDDILGIELVRRITVLVLIFGLTWAATRAVRAVADWLMHLEGNSEDHYSARRVLTQARMLSRTVSFMVVVIGVATALMTFPNVRQIGASMLASAGVLGIVVGFAARPVLSNLLAGLQIAITQPIRIDDVVIVENEWGWIEEITGTYVVVRIWDYRRLVVPLNYFIETPFQNWTRHSSQIIGSVFWWVDYRMPMAPLRAELERLCQQAPEWDGKLQLLQVTDTTDRAVQIRALVTAADSPRAWDLRCRIREGMIDFLQREYPQYLARQRNELLDGREPTEGPGDSVARPL